MEPHEARIPCYSLGLPFVAPESRVPVAVQLARESAHARLPHVETMAGFTPSATQPAPAAAASAPADPRVTTWRHGYRTGIAQTIEQLRRLGGATEGPRVELEDAIRMLEAWRADLG